MTKISNLSTGIPCAVTPVVNSKNPQGNIQGNIQVITQQDIQDFKQELVQEIIKTNAAPFDANELHEFANDIWSDFAAEIASRPKYRFSLDKYCQSLGYTRQEALKEKWISLFIELDLTFYILKGNTIRIVSYRPNSSFRDARSVLRAFSFFLISCRWCTPVVDEPTAAQEELQEEILGNWEDGPKHSKR